MTNTKSRKQDLSKAPEQKAFVWHSESGDFQEMWADIRRWTLDVQPTNTGLGLYLALKFEGVAKSGALAGQRVLAEVLLRDRGTVNKYMEDRLQCAWGDVQGYGQINNHDGYGTKLDLSLYCEPAAFDWVCRVFAAATNGAVLRLSVRLDRPAEAEGFWQERWLNELLRIGEWRIHSDCALASSATGDA